MKCQRFKPAAEEWAKFWSTKTLEYTNQRHEDFLLIFVKYPNLVDTRSSKYQRLLQMKCVLERNMINACLCRQFQGFAFNNWKRENQLEQNSTLP